MKLTLNTTISARELAECDLADFEYVVEQPLFNLKIAFDLHYQVKGDQIVLRSFGSRKLTVLETGMVATVADHVLQDLESRFINAWFMSHLFKHRQTIEPKILEAIDRCRIMSSCYS